MKVNSTMKKMMTTIPKELDWQDVRDIINARSYVVYGRSGTGKTTIAGTFPKPMLYLNIRDNGTDSISDVEGIQVLNIHNFDDLEMTYWWLAKNIKRFKTVVLDTITQLNELAVKAQLLEIGKQDVNPGDWGTMTKRDWGAAAGLMKQWISRFCDLSSKGIEIVFLAQDKVFNIGDEQDDDQLLKPYIGPNTSPSVAALLNASVGMIAYTYVRLRHVKRQINGKKKEVSKIEYCLRVGPDPDVLTKIRKPIGVEVPSFIINATYEDIINIITGEE